MAPNNILLHIVSKSVQHNFSGQELPKICGPYVKTVQHIALVLILDNVTRVYFTGDHLMRRQTACLHPQERLYQPNIRGLDR